MQKITCWYTNAGVLSNKIIELKLRLKQCAKKPQILFICEIKPKNARYPLTPEEISIPGYNLYIRMEREEDRGIAIFVHESICAWQVNMTTKFDEALWIRVKSVNKEEVLMGCVYRSPQSTKENNALLRNILVEANSGKDANVLIMGDFNYPKINWQTWSTEGGSVDNEEYKFIEAVRDSFMYQHVCQATRGRGVSSPSVLDLIMTKEESVISDIIYESLLGKSDHCVIVFDVQFFTPGSKCQYRKILL